MISGYHKTLSILQGKVNFYTVWVVHMNLSSSKDIEGKNPFTFLFCQLKAKQNTPCDICRLGFRQLPGISPPWWIAAIHLMSCNAAHKQQKSAQIKPSNHWEILSAVVSLWQWWTGTLWQSSSGANKKRFAHYLAALSDFLRKGEVAKETVRQWTFKLLQKIIVSLNALLKSLHLKYFGQLRARVWEIFRAGEESAESPEMARWHEHNVQGRAEAEGWAWGLHQLQSTGDRLVSIL